MDDRGILELLMEMVKAPSHPGVERQEEAAALALAGYLRERGLPADIFEVREGRPNLVASIAGPKPGPHLLLCGHLDTVPPNAGSSADFFSAASTGRPDVRARHRGHEGRPGGHGRGPRRHPRFRRAGLRPRHPRRGHRRGDGEPRRGSPHPRAASGPTAPSSASRRRTGWPSATRDWSGSRSDSRAGPPTAARPEAGISAHRRRGPLRLASSRRELVPAFERRRDPVLGLPAINMGTIRGGQQPSMVAADCAVQLDRRWVTTETIDQVMGDLEAILARVREARLGLETEPRADARRHGHHAPRPAGHRPGPPAGRGRSGRVRRPGQGRRSD
ncbi:MAG: peptidase dimerization domain-containing protein [Desulfobacterales bacterium]|nr:peptidase dimerization domain-containing protein [Desulfobacterales bacterium]